MVEQITRLAVFASGNGSNFQALVDAQKKNFFDARIVLLVCDNPDAFVLKRAQKEGVKSALVTRKDFSSKKDFEDAIDAHLEKERVDLIALAGFMRMLSASFVEQYAGRIINIHPALLPAFKGARAIKDAFDSKVKTTGVTVHYVDELMDHGPVILQKEVSIADNDTLQTLEAKIHSVEHVLYPEAIRLLVDQRKKSHSAF